MDDKALETMVRIWPHFVWPLLKLCESWRGAPPAAVAAGMIIAGQRTLCDLGAPQMALTMLKVAEGDVFEHYGPSVSNDDPEAPAREINVIDPQKLHEVVATWPEHIQPILELFLTYTNENKLAGPEVATAAICAAHMALCELVSPQFAMAALEAAADHLRETYPKEAAEWRQGKPGFIEAVPRSRQH